jgi:anti-anti-sigma factor
VSTLPAPDIPLTVTVRFDGPRAVIAAQGELDMATVGAVRSAFDELRSTDWPTIVADLRGLTFIDSRGLCLLLELTLDARENDWAFAIVDGCTPVRELLAATGLTTYFDRADVA